MDHCIRRRAGRGKFNFTKSMAENPVPVEIIGFPPVKLKSFGANYLSRSLNEKFGLLAGVDDRKVFVVQIEPVEFQAPVFVDADESDPFYSFAWAPPCISNVHLAVLRSGSLKIWEAIFTEYALIKDDLFCI